MHKQLVQRIKEKDTVYKDESKVCDMQKHAAHVTNVEITRQRATKAGIHSDQTKTQASAQLASVNRAHYYGRD